MADPIGVIIRFTGDSDDLVERFERARKRWIEEQAGDYAPPIVYAVCESGEGIAIVSIWEDAVAHRAFGQGLHPHIDAVGLPKPDRIDRMRIRTLGWD